MKMKYTTGLLLFTAGALLTFLAGCEKVLDNFDFLETDPKLVINAPFIADSTILMHISHTVNILDDPEFTFTANAEARLYSDENLISTATYIDSGLYTFDVLPRAGEVYTLKVDASGYPSVEAEIRMPPEPSLRNIEYLSWEEYGPRLDITIADNTRPYEAYGISIKSAAGYFEYDNNGNITDTIVDGYQYSYLSSRNINVTGSKSYGYYSSERWDDNIEGTTLMIEDDLVNGKEFTIDLNAYDLSFPVMIDSAVYVYFESYDRDYLSFLKSYELYDNSEDNPIAEKVSIFSNIEGGLGVAYGKTITRTAYRFPPGTRDDIIYPVW
jgi:hypothetical protein